MDPLFQPSRINSMELPNRFVRSATWAGMADEDGGCTPRLTTLMTDLALGGVGLIITGHAYVRVDGKHAPGQLGLYKDDLIPSLRTMTHQVHQHGGKIALQLGFGGAYLSKTRVGKMRIADMKDLVSAYGKAALRAKQADFDGVQIFAAHGFFLSQLLCPRYNPRDDIYGGSIENRSRALMEVLDAVRRAVGPDYPVLIKLNAHDIIPDGLRLTESVQVGRMLANRGADALELSGGLLNIAGLLDGDTDEESDTPFFYDEACAFKREVDLPLILVGGIRGYHTALRVVAQEAADYVALCRPLICEPGLIRRWQNGDSRKAQCISCNNCVELLKQGKGLACQPVQPEPPQTFFPQLAESIPAGPPHPEGTCYYIAMGLETWGSGFVPVIKFQLRQGDDTLSQSPSIPLDSDDALKISRALEKLVAEHRKIQP